MNRTAVGGVGAAVSTVVATVLGASPASAALAPAATTPITGPYSVVASGLDNPKRLSFDPATRELFIAEAGHGGDTCDDSGLCNGFTGAIARIGRPDRVVNGTPTMVVKNLISFALPDGTDATGPDGTSAAFNKLAIVTTGAPSGSVAGADELFRANRRTGSLKPIADLGAYEAANDPDQTGVASDPS